MRNNYRFQTHNEIEVPYAHSTDLTMTLQQCLVPSYLQACKPAHHVPPPT